ncbi:hypothetical protein [Pseudooceanicola batsensis]|uniref:hypothetical protein n=1 Tax=Pseudooceanicola batsensis TaxID=314255 RepID=UPI0003248DEC|nr:hypothetical protein [Pseudooceanicola batsensis]
MRDRQGAGHLGERKGSQETLLDKEKLFQKVGFPVDAEDRFLPLCGRWESRDGVHVGLVSALLPERGAVKQCSAFAKTPDHDLWLPSFGSDGRIDRYRTKGLFDPLIWEPEKYPIGIDERDKWATRGAIARPKLGLALNKLLGLRADENERYWQDNTGKQVLKSEVWGEWRPDPDGRGSRYQDEGSILWAKRDWLDEVLESHKKGLIYKLSFSKYKSSRSYDDSLGVREIYVGLKRGGEQMRFWYAKKASEMVY